MHLLSSIRKRLGWPADSRQAFGIFLMTGHYLVKEWLTPTDICLFFRLGPHHVKIINIVIGFRYYPDRQTGGTRSF